MTAASRHRLGGFEPDNLLAFLALLGVLRALDIVRPEWRPRADWDPAAPVRPFLVTSEVTDPRAIAIAASEACSIYAAAFSPLAFRSRRVPAKSKPKKGKGGEETASLGPMTKWTIAAEAKGLASTRSRYELLQRRALAIATPNLSGNRPERACARRVRTEIVASLSSPAFDDENVYDTPLKLPSGQQSFVGRMHSAIAQVAAAPRVIEDALFRPWGKATPGISLRLDPADARRYAHRATDPTAAGEEPGAELGATALAAIGMTLLTLAPKAGCVAVNGYVGTERDGEMSWPLWATRGTGWSLDAIVATLTHPEMIAPEPNMKLLHGMGAFALMRCRRFVLDPTRGDYGNVSRAVAFW